MSLTAAKIAEFVSGILHGNPDATADDVSAISSSKSGTLSFLGDARELHKLTNTSASIVLIPEECDPGKLQFSGEALIVTADPFTQFISLIPHFRNTTTQPAPQIHPSAIIDPTASISHDAYIGPHVSIAAGCRIGARCQIHANVVIGENSTLGEDVKLYPNSVLYGNCELQDRVIIHAGAVIGADGFGYQFREGAFHKIEHYGSVILEQDVEIGSCTTVDRGMFEPTVVGRGSKIDNHVMIAHNCRIGQHNVIVSQVGMAGSVTTGNYCRFGGQVGIADHVTIGEGASIMAQAGVFRDVELGQTMLGAPALPKEQQAKIMMAQTKLPEMRQTLRKLQKEMDAVQKKLDQQTDSPESIKLRPAA
ncbi:UDP-3-O-(3-hydroxymyristoyl)glucosamine N-acyltransferase [Rubinisphaera italica]|uniref:UDP-3-O-acylglucosamine N-acyltransferase n=1 Tax=Rubinisphaera italica TaxID=2527969 RepID=A0A5C5XLQ0_9PLAN|nr:UDP-3-O-(3-hydroxymyristoyl)glucosamine N-acyltransferase [Rubinisphaera italica]TWT63618.1 UDP-3-O-acylglucosamine N-acyltransferase [Rubinisphaera italica]